MVLVGRHRPREVAGPTQQYSGFDTELDCLDVPSLVPTPDKRFVINRVTTESSGFSDVYAMKLLALVL